MKRLLQVSSLLIISGLLLFGCSSTTSTTIEELTDGTFTASIDNQSSFDGDASFEITIPSSDYDQEASQDSVLFLTLSTGEITWTRELNGESIELTVNKGLSLNADWKDDSTEFVIGSTFFRNTFVHPGSLDMHDFKSGTIMIDEKTQDLLAGNFDLISKNSLGNEFNITGKFRAILSE